MENLTTEKPEMFSFLDACFVVSNSTCVAAASATAALSEKSVPGRMP